MTGHWDAELLRGKLAKEQNVCSINRCRAGCKIQDHRERAEAALERLRDEVDRLAELCDRETDRACDEGILATKLRKRLDAVLVLCDNPCPTCFEPEPHEAIRAAAAGVPRA